MKTFAPFRLFLSVLALASVALYAPAAAPEAPTRGQLTGTLRDGGSHEAIPQANVVLLRAADGAYVATAATRADGSFAFHHVPFGRYRLQPTVLGYEPMRPVVAVSARQPHLALGTVELMPYGAPLAGQLLGTPEPAPASRVAKVGNAGRFVLTSAHRQRLTASRPVQL
ncbi:carboxypeptidase regulatory-like domain-containing protein [Hymenobacter edaphi]|nr:carboxypeptidase regulatory-like domain-containing protein [Hymenobacter edaphi]